MRDAEVMSFFLCPAFSALLCVFSLLSFLLLFLLLENTSNFISLQFSSSLNSCAFHIVLYSYRSWYSMYLPRSFLTTKFDFTIEILHLFIIEVITFFPFSWQLFCGSKWYVEMIINYKDIDEMVLYNHTIL